MSESVFKFKEFSIQQSRSAMKISTDGILLGAWTPIYHNPVNILDIGAGTGLISLMLAQRSNAEAIDAIEIDDDAYEECVENFERSPWSDRLFCYHASFLEFVAEIDDQFDLIVSNPPFFANAVNQEMLKEISLDIQTLYHSNIYFMVFQNYYQKQANFQ